MIRNQGIYPAIWETGCRISGSWISFSVSLGFLSWNERGDRGTGGHLRPPV